MECHPIAFGIIKNCHEAVFTDGSFWHYYLSTSFLNFVKVGRLPLLEYKAAFAELRQQLFPDDAEPLVPADMLSYIDYREWIDWKLNPTKELPGGKS